MRRDGQHRDAVAVAVVEAVDQVQVARATGTRTDSERAGEVGLGPGCEGRRLLVTNMHPLDLALAAKCIGQPVQAITDDAVNPLDAGGFKGFGELICDGLHNLAPSRATQWRRLVAFVMSSRLTGGATYWYTCIWILRF